MPETAFLFATLVALLAAKCAALIMVDSNDLPRPSRID
jgi:hypothetical protein